MRTIAQLVRVASLLSLMAGLLLGCASQVTLPQPPDSSIDRTVFRDVSALACGFQLFQLLPLGTNDRRERAYRELQEQAQGTYIGDIEMTEDWYYGVVGSVYCTSFKGKAYSRTKS